MPAKRSKQGMGHKPVQDFIEFRDMGFSASGKTKVWYVVNTLREDDVPGIIKWNGAWRKYVFYTDPSFYDWECLRLIADFLEKVTLEHRNANRTAKGIAIAWVVMDNGGVPVDDTPHPVKLKTGVVKPNPRPVKKPKPIKIVKPKRVFNRQPVGARQHGGAPRCSFCGAGMAAEIGSIHARCQEAKDRIAGKK